MPHRASWLKLLASFLAVAIFVLGTAVPAAHAKKPPKNTQLPNGRPFQIIQGMFNDVDERLDKLEANAPKAGTMWINPLDLTPGLPTTTLSAAPFPTPGLIVSAGVVDVLQVGLQVPLGFAIAGARVCYTPVAAASVSSVTLTKNNPTPPFGSIPIGTAPGAVGATCVTLELDDDDAYDPSAATGGPAYLAIGVSAGSLTIHGIALDLAPIVVAP